MKEASEAAKMMFALVSYVENHQLCIDELVPGVEACCRSVDGHKMAAVVLCQFLKALERSDPEANIENVMGTLL